MNAEKQQLRAEADRALNPMKRKRVLGKLYNP